LLVAFAVKARFAQPKGQYSHGETDLTPEPMLLMYPCSMLHPVIQPYLITARRTFIKQVSSYLMKLKYSQIDTEINTDAGTPLVYAS